MTDIIVLLVVAAALFFCIRSIIRNKSAEALPAAVQAAAAAAAPAPAGIRGKIRNTGQGHLFIV